MGIVGIVGIVGTGMRITTTGQRLLLVVALTLVFTIFGLETIPPAGALTEMWATMAGIFVWTSLVWDGRSRPGAKVGLHLLAQWMLFVGFALGFGWGVLDTLWMGTANLLGGVLMLVVFARFHRGSTWAPTTVSANLLLLGSAILGTAVVALLGGFPNLEIGQLDRLTLWWVIRGTVYAYVAAVTLLCIFHGDRRSTVHVSGWVMAGLIPMGVACVWVTYHDPALPLTWFLLLPALVAGSVMSPRGAATYALYVAMLSAFATLQPINQFGYTGFLPGSVIIDLLVTASTFITMHLAILRLQWLTATDELDEQRRGAEDQAELLRTAFESMSDGLVVLDTHGAVVLHNLAARKLMGRRIPVGTPLDWITYFGLTRADGQPLEPADLAADADGRYNQQLRVDNDLSHRVLDVGRWPLSGASGRTVVLFSDVTAQSERLSELTGFAGVVAHDLRGPLSSLHGWLELANDSLDGADPLEASAFVARAQLSSARMQQVIDDWLAYTVQRDGLLTKAAVPLPSVLEEIVSSYGATDSTAAPDFLVAAEHSVTADRVLTKQLLANLIGNAVKYTAADEPPRVEIRSFLDAERGFVRIEVRDRGIGLPPGEEEKVFDEFHRAAAHADDYAGTGLGLSLCRRIVDRHGGTIVARNNPDRGATFSFTLPAG